MATEHLPPESADVIQPDHFAPAAAARMAASLLNRHSPHEIAEAIEVLVDVLDLIGGDPESENDDPAEAVGDEHDAAWIEWHRMRGSQKSGSNIAGQNEDDEDDDPAEDDDPDSCAAHDDRGTDAPGGDDGQPGVPEDHENSHDHEIEQMLDDVPTVPVYAIEPNLFTGKRECLGMSNLQPSFKGNGANVKAAD